MSAKTIGRYEILRELGRGGMATVYLGHDPKLERKVAIKVLPSQYANDPEFFDRFEQEAKTLATLQHNAIVGLFDSGEEEGFPYFIMQLMEGGSLKEKIGETELEADDILAIIGRIAAALDKAHSQGIVHRDVKPANILFDDDGEAYLSDFGIVKLTQASDGLTRTGGSVGTAHYMSPEQLDGVDDIDGRADIYALTVVLYEILAGDPPYNHSSSPRIMVMHLNEPIPNILEKRPNLPPKVDDIIKKGMAKERDERYAKAADLVADLKPAFKNWDPDGATAAVVEQEPIQASPQTEPKTEPVADPIEPVTRLQAQPSVETVAPLASQAAASSGWLYALAGAGGLAIIALIFIGIYFLRDRTPEPEPFPTIQLTQEATVEVALVDPTDEPTVEPTDEPAAIVPTSTAVPTQVPPTVPVAVVPTSTPSPTAEPSATPIPPTNTPSPTAVPNDTPVPVKLADVIAAGENLLNYPELIETNLNRAEADRLQVDGGAMAHTVERSSPVVTYFLDEGRSGTLVAQFVIADATGDAFKNGRVGILFNMSKDGKSFNMFELDGQGLMRAFVVRDGRESQRFGVSFVECRSFNAELGAENEMAVVLTSRPLPRLSDAEVFVNGRSCGSFQEGSIEGTGFGISTRVSEGSGSVTTKFSSFVFKQ